MKKLMKTTALFMFILSFCNIASAQKSNAAFSDFDLNHPAPLIASVSVGQIQATVSLKENVTAKYDIISCKNIFTGETSIMRQGASKTVFLTNLDAGSYYEVSLKHAYSDGEVSKALEFCFTTEPATQGITMQMFDESEK